VFRPIRAAVLAAVLAAFAAACANTSADPSTPSGTPILSTAPASTAGSAPASTVPSGMDNGVAALAPNEILSRAQAALLQTQSVHIKASGGANGSAFTADVTVKAHTGGAGTLTVPGGAGGRTFDVDVVTLGSTAYVKGDAAAWQTILGKTPTVPDIDQKWVRAGTDNVKLKTLTSFGDVAAIATGILVLDDNVTKGATTTIDGTAAIALTGVGPTDATVYVATTGQPYPLRIQQSGGAAGELDLGSFDQPVTVDAPPAADTIEATQLGL
jgi:hypothetical protein